MIKYKYAMKKLIYLSTLLFLFVLPMMAQQPLFPTPAKVQNGKGSFVIGKNLQVQGNGNGYSLPWPSEADVDPFFVEILFQSSNADFPEMEYACR